MASPEKNNWRKGWNITDEKRNWYRSKSKDSAKRKRLAEKNLVSVHESELRVPRQNNDDLMPVCPSASVDSISLFSGCGGLDIGFERTGYNHLLSVDILDICGATIKKNRPNWIVRSGPNEGDVQKINWKTAELQRRSEFLVIHGGPPCQPFSNSGRQLGENDERDMVPEFVRAVAELQPDAFCLENVPALGNKKFAPYLQAQLSSAKNYNYIVFKMFAPLFGVPQRRERLFVVGFRDKRAFKNYRPPVPTHDISKFWQKHSILKKYQKDYLPNAWEGLPPTYGMREALGFDTSFDDNLSPTFRSGFTGPRNSTSILNGSSSQKIFKQMGLWGNGIAMTPQKALSFPTPDGTSRLSVEDCSIIQGFPQNWEFEGAVYQIIGQIGNSVAPPVAYQVANSILDALRQ